LTKLEYDAAGNLQKIVDPDTKARTFSYDAQRHITQEIDKRGFAEQTLYDFAGRAIGGIRSDGSQLQVAPVQVQGLYPEQDTINPLNAPVAKPLGAVEASYADGSGGVVTQILDQTGQVVSAKDGGGLKPAFERNQNLLVTKRTDARGNVTSYDYDAKGNVKSISDSLSGTPQTPPIYNGQLFAAETFVGNAGYSSRIKDVNDDGIPDIISVNYNNVLVLPGKGDGTFAAPKYYPVANQSESVAVGDVNGDGKNDIVTASPYGGTNPSSGRVSVLLGDGSGNFGTQTNYAVGDGARSVAVGDINKDGKNDIVTANTSSKSISVLLSNSSGSFSRTDIPLNSAIFSLESVILNDLDKDGNLDIITASSSGTNSTGSVSVLLGNSNGTFVTQTNYAVGRGVRSVAVGDINKDGINDIVTASPASGGSVASVLLGNSNGSFASATNYRLRSNISPQSLAIGDLDLDSDLDVIVSGSGYGSESIMLNNGSGMLSSPTDNTSGYSQSSFVALEDLDLDGDLDQVLSRYGSLYVSLNNTVRNEQGGGTGKRSFTYDPVFNQVTTETDELGRQTLYEIDPITGNRRKMTQVVGAVGGSDDVVTSYTYTNKNLIDIETDPNGRVTDYDYNAQNQLAKITVAKGTPDEAVQQFEYDAAGIKRR
jgi:YD repeat-containing protein